jgi:hypothetical protein
LRGRVTLILFGRALLRRWLTVGRRLGHLSAYRPPPRLICSDRRGQTSPAGREWFGDWPNEDVVPTPRTMEDTGPGPSVEGHASAAGVQLTAVLESAVNSDGGWPYAVGGSSRLEPTCWALLSLIHAAPGAAAPSRVSAALNCLAGWRRADGLLADVAGAPPNLAFNGLAAVAVIGTLTARRPGAGGSDGLLDAILAGLAGIKGVQLGSSDNQAQDNTLVGWPWIGETFSWTEPTCWCVLALKKARAARRAPAATERVREAERMLVDRCCLAGGWNYGNANMLGKELSPYVPTTALALLALRDKPDLPAVVRSLDWLRRNQFRERSLLALSMTLVATRVFGGDSRTLEEAIGNLLAATSAPANLATAALTAYALQGNTDSCDVLAT